VVVRHGVPLTKIQAMSEEELNTQLAEQGLSTEGRIEDRQVRLWEALLPIYPMPKARPVVSELVFSAVLDDNDEPRPEGADRSAIVQDLLDFGYPDEATANQAIETQIENLIRYYGFRVVPSAADVIIVERR
jgi:hypothetical protein